MIKTDKKANAQEQHVSDRWQAQTMPTIVKLKAQLEKWSSVLAYPEPASHRKDTDLKIELVEYINCLEVIEQQAAKDLQQASNVRLLRSQIFKNFQHVIMEPTSAIVTYLDVMSRAEDDQSKKQLLIDTREWVESLTGYHNKITELMALSTGLEVVDDKEFSVDNIVGQVVTLQKLAGHPSRKIIVNYKNEIPAVVIGNDLWLLTILLNMVRNAMMSIRSGEILIIINQIEQLENNCIAIQFVVTSQNIVIDHTRPSSGIEPVLSECDLDDENSILNNKRKKQLMNSVMTIKQLVDNMQGEFNRCNNLDGYSYFDCTLPFQLPANNRK